MCNCVCACKCVCICICKERRIKKGSRYEDVCLVSYPSVVKSLVGTRNPAHTVEEREIIHELGPCIHWWTLIFDNWCSIVMFTLMRCTGLSGCDFLHTSAVSVLLINFHPSSWLLDCSSCKMRSWSKMICFIHVSTFWRSMICKYQLPILWLITCMQHWDRFFFSVLVT